MNWWQTYTAKLHSSTAKFWLNVIKLTYNFQSKIGLLSRLSSNVFPSDVKSLLHNQPSPSYTPTYLAPMHACMKIKYVIVIGVCHLNCQILLLFSDWGEYMHLSTESWETWDGVSVSPLTRTLGEICSVFKMHCFCNKDCIFKKSWNLPVHASLEHLCCVVKVERCILKVLRCPGRWEMFGQFGR